MQRLDYFAAAEDLVKPMVAFEDALHGGEIEPALRYLIKLRASQINGCAYSLYMHAREARRAGVDQVRLDVLSAWRESPLFSARERAALACTEALTRLADTGARRRL